MPTARRSGAEGALANIVPKESPQKSQFFLDNPLTDVDNNV